MYVVCCIQIYAVKLIYDTFRHTSFTNANKTEILTSPVEPLDMYILSTNDETWAGWIFIHPKIIAWHICSVTVNNTVWYLCECSLNFLLKTECDVIRTILQLFFNKPNKMCNVDRSRRNKGHRIGIGDMEFYVHIIAARLCFTRLSVMHYANKHDTIHNRLYNSNIYIFFCQ